MDKDTAYLDDTKIELEEDYTFQEEDEFTVIEDDSSANAKQESVSGRYFNVRKKIMSPLKLSWEKIFHREQSAEKATKDGPGTAEIPAADISTSIGIANEPTTTSVAAFTPAPVSCDTPDEPATTMVATMTPSPVVNISNDKIENIFNRKIILRKILRHSKKRAKSSLRTMLGVNAHIESLKQENERLHDLIHTNESNAETLKREIKYWQSLYQSVEKPGPFKTEIAYQQSIIDLQSQTIKLLAQAQTDLFVHDSTQKEWPLISIIMPVWDRADMVCEAIESVIAQTYTHWELIIVDDGSVDKTRRAIKPYLKDERIQYHHQNHVGVSAARNKGLEHSKGSLIAYLDSDNAWLPHTLTIVINAFLSDPQCRSVFFAAIWHDANNKKWLYFPEKFNYDQAILENKRKGIMGIDINCFVHQRALYENLGGFDDSLSRLADYELTYRYQKQAEVKHLPFIGTNYRYCIADNSIAATENCWYNFYRIRTKYQQSNEQPTQSLRVLYLADSYPQLTESYLHTEIDYMRRRGVHIEVWSEQQSAANFKTDITIHSGSLIDVLQKMHPDVVHAHWLTSLRHADKVAQFGIPMTVRGHGCEYSPELLRQVHNHPAVNKIYLFPHIYKQYQGTLKNIKSLPACFNPQQYFPRKDKNKRLVVRVAAASPANNLQFFIRVAAHCKDHRFILVLGHCAQYPDYVEKIIEYNKKRGNHVDIRIDMTPDVISLLVQEAGIYFHTDLMKDEKGWMPYGMPMSICEAMATGAYIIARDCVPAKQYIGRFGDFYLNENEAAELIHATANWPDEEWHLRQQRFINRAYQYFLDDQVLAKIFSDWQSIQLQSFVPSASLDSLTF